jgi:hypothetical protein
MDRDENFFVAGTVSNRSPRYFADADAFHVSFCAELEALVITEGSLLAKFRLKL